MSAIRETSAGLAGGQYRTKATVEGPLGKIYVGSVPSYNSAPTGALTIFDEATLTKKVITDLVPGGAVLCLAADDAFVFGSGGGKLFLLEPKTSKLVRQRDLGCGSMIVAADGKLVVSAAGQVQRLDPRTLETRWSIPFASIKGLDGFARMVLGRQGTLYGTSKLGIFRVDVEAGKLERLTRLGSDHLAADKAGRLYFSQGANLYMVDPVRR